MKQLFRNIALVAAATLMLAAFAFPASAGLHMEAERMGMKTVEMPIDDLKPYAHNPRRNEAAYDTVMESILNFGFLQPCVVDKNNVLIVGHTRYEAAKRLGFKTVPTVVADLSETKAKQYRIADNRTGEESDWDFDLLVSELKELELDGEELTRTGFSQTEIDKLMKPLEQEPETEGEAKAILEDGDRVAEGDVWDLGGHQLRVGRANLAEADSIIKHWKDGTGKSARLVKSKKPIVAKRSA